MVVDSSRGHVEMGFYLSFGSQGHLKGKIDSPQGLFDITGEVVDEEIYFGFTIDANGQEMAINFESYWDESDMEGDVYFGNFGCGDW